MTNPKRNLRGLTDLGKAVDERIAAKSKQLDLRHDTGKPLPAPLSGGGFGGGSGGGSEPTLPEQFVETLKVQGESEALSGELVMTGTGDLSLVQSAQSPHFAFSSPSYSAADGVARDGNEFSCDATLVRTSGDQTVSGTKSFSDFPLTPSTAPAADYEVTNKKYVDDSIPAALWQRDSQQESLSPAESGDRVVVAADDAQGAVKGLSAGGGPGLVGESSSGYGVKADSAANKALHADGCLDLDELSVAELNTLGSASAGDQRWYAKEDGRAYSRTSDGAVHDLTVQHKQVLSAAAGADGGSQTNLVQDTAAYPPTASAASVSTQVNVGFNFSNAKLASTYFRLSWTSTQQAGEVDSGAQVAIGAPLRKYGDGADRAGNCRIVVKARLRINSGARFKDIKLLLNDVDSSDAVRNSISVDRLSTLSASAGSWVEVTLASAGTDISAWEKHLRVGVVARGTDVAANVGLTELDVEWIAVEQWCK